MKKQSVIILYINLRKKDRTQLNGDNIKFHNFTLNKNKIKYSNSR